MFKYSPCMPALAASAPLREALFRLLLPGRRMETHYQKDARSDIARAVLAKYSVALFIVAYNAERFIGDVLLRVPEPFRELFSEIYIIDDFSDDATFNVACEMVQKLGLKNAQILRTPFNRGYGGNQKLGYLHAIKRNFDYVILLHGDAQYPPESLPEILLAIDDGKADAVIGSRMINRLSALRGHMPVYKWIGNQVLSILANVVLGSSLSEWHSGFRAYRVSMLKSVPFQLNSNDFHFDTEILIQILATRHRVKEVGIPTHYGDEICHVNGFAYAFNCIKALVKYRLTQIGLFYQPNFDFALFEQSNYRLKMADTSLHQMVLGRKWPKHWQVADLGSNDGAISAILAERVAHVTSVDGTVPKHAGKAVARGIDLNSAFDQELGAKSFDCVLALDVLEHLNSPEKAIERIAHVMKPGGWLYASTGNVAHVFIRLSLLFGQFNYGKRGVLDLSHTRLFTDYSFKKLLSQGGFLVREVKYFGPPIADMVGDSWPLRVLDRIASVFARWWPGLFAYEILLVAQRMDDLEEIYTATTAPSAPVVAVPQQH